MSCGGAFGEKEAVRAAAQAASGLWALHAAGIPHGDLSSGTVVLKGGEGGEAMLAAYGLSLPAAAMERAAAMDRPGGLTGSVWLSASGASVGAGAFQYAPPEAGEAAAAGAGSPEPGSPTSVRLAKKADIYALALVIYERFTGLRPWQGKNMMQVHRAVVERRERPIWPPFMGIDAAVKALVERMWAHEPADRPEAEEICAILQETLARVGGGLVAGGETAAAANYLWDSVATDDVQVMTVTGVSGQTLPDEEDKMGEGDTSGGSAPNAEIQADWLSATANPGGGGHVEDLTRTVRSGGDLFDPDEHRVEEETFLSKTQLAAAAAVAPSHPPGTWAPSVAKPAGASSSASAESAPCGALLAPAVDQLQGKERGMWSAPPDSCVRSCASTQPLCGNEQAPSAPSPSLPAAVSCAATELAQKPETLASALPVALESSAESSASASASTPTSPESSGLAKLGQVDTPVPRIDPLPEPSNGHMQVPDSLSTSPMTTDTEAARARRASAVFPPVALSSAAVGASSTHLQPVPHVPSSTAFEDRVEPPPRHDIYRPAGAMSTGQAGSSANSSVKQGPKPPTGTSSPRKNFNDIGLMSTAEWDVYKQPIVDILGSSVRRQERETRRRDGDAGEFDGMCGSGDTNGSAVGVVSERTKERRKARRLQELIEESGLVRFTEALGSGGASSSLDSSAGLSHRRRHPRTRDRLEPSPPTDDDKTVAEIQAAARRLDATFVIGEMRAYPGSIAIARAGTVAICELANDEYAFYDACEEGALDELCAAVARHGEDELIALSFCQSISAFSKWYDDRIGHIIRALGVPASVVSVMDAMSNSLCVQTEGCRALAAICGTNEVNRMVCASLRGMFALHKAMARNIIDWKDVRLAKASLLAFKSIAENNEDAAESLLKVCALDTVCRSAEVFGNDDIEDNILSALEAVTFYRKGKEKVIQAHGMHAVSTIMLRDQSPLFSNRCFKFITSISEVREESCQAELLDSAVVERIVVALRTPGITGPAIAGSLNTSKLAQEAAFEGVQALGFLGSFGQALQDQCRLVGAIETVFQVLNAHSSNAKCAKMCARAFFFLLEKNMTSIGYARSHGIVNSLYAAKEMHSEDGRVVREVCYVLNLLTSRPLGPPAANPQRRGWRSRNEAPRAETAQTDGRGSTKGMASGHLEKAAESKDASTQSTSQISACDEQRRSGHLGATAPDEGQPGRTVPAPPDSKSISHFQRLFSWNNRRRR